MPNNTQEEWDINMISRARKAHRAGASLEDIMLAMGTRLSPTYVRQKLAKYGMRFERKSTANHRGKGHTNGHRRSQDEGERAGDSSRGGGNAAGQAEPA